MLRICQQWGHIWPGRLLTRSYNEGIPTRRNCFLYRGQNQFAKGNRTVMEFKLLSSYKPQGDQAKAIEDVNRPALILAHNKTLAAQLYHEFKSFFPHNAVEYFVSYYDYYQPEAYIPAADVYIEKEATINDELDKLRLSATKSLFERRDCIIVASVSCIYGLGSPEAY